jgi:hypothetical protein
MVDHFQHQEEGHFFMQISQAWTTQRLMNTYLLLMLSPPAPASRIGRASC